jgi:hypothetical protein
VTGTLQRSPAARAGCDNLHRHERRQHCRSDQSRMSRAQEVSIAHRHFVSRDQDRSRDGRRRASTFFAHVSYSVAIFQLYTASINELPGTSYPESAFNLASSGCKRPLAKSALGQSLPKCDVRGMSALPPIATKERTSRHVSKVPKADVTRKPI